MRFAVRSPSGEVRVEREIVDLDAALWGAQTWTDPESSSGVAMWGAQAWTDRGSPSGAAAALAIVAFMAFVTGLALAALLWM
jgi:hypothetical protein